MSVLFTETFTNTQYTALATHSAAWSDQAGTMRIGTSGAKVGCAGTSRSEVPAYTPVDALVEIDLFVFTSAGVGPILHYGSSGSGFWDWRGYWLYCTSTGITVYRGDQDGGGDSVATRSVTLVSGDKVGLRHDGSGNLYILVNDVQQGAAVAELTYASGPTALMSESTADDYGDNFRVTEVDSGVVIPVLMNQYRQRWR